ncbi:hypothetical protein [Micromonospora siamensis]|uniref:Uncharacterized protein n=1 Tax=Micromonospora siamensis TaxID=299152 RepID=A0A1C5GV27_9ACTN|nr:hypothetical protein [Micromonospora siamensis]SCG37649.1 hypothetical protein GA0074704_0554 [Micromonospora siamensis]
MTSGDFSQVDHDLLADFVGGALEGTPEQATVNRLVDEDAAWSTAYARLLAALPQVHDDLARWAAGPAPEMPLAVTERIAAALAGAGPAPVGTADLPRQPGPGTPRPAADEPARPAGDLDHAHPDDTRSTDELDGSRPAGGPHTADEPDGPRPAGERGGQSERGDRDRSRPAGGTGPGRRRRRWTRLAGPVALAAAAMMGAGLGVNQLVRTESGGDRGALSDAPAPGQARTALATPFGAAAPRTTYSGTDWTPAALAGGVLGAGGSPAAKRPPAGKQSPAAKQPGFQPDSESDHGRLAGPGTLDRLTDPAALDTCLGEITTEHGAGPLTVDVVDYAAFQGAPALVVGFVDAAGARWAWVSGPECGVPGSGADTRYRSRVG